MVASFCLAQAFGAASWAWAQDLGRGTGMTITKAAWTWRIARTDQDATCRTRQLALCRTTTLTIENTSAQNMACVAQLRFAIASDKPDAAGMDWTENAGLQVDAGGATPAIISEFVDRVDPQLSFVVCWTTQERDDSDDGDAPFARAAPSECKVQVVSSPALADFFPSGSIASGEGGLVRVRIALPLAEGLPKVLGVSVSSGFLRIDRAALLLASQMKFKTNCPGTQRLLPIRFQLKE